ncbi:hypothetical protein WR25_21196 [Diploscapter pachys]|uniref:Uncharacterized protein n=1 Tax=Diploscapter pachys TaxID=2018661 RepID=A0A2A2KLQ3_9BILA|nr:hypothetical protein WR25_21196 [Diploscapter pachys]
MRTFASSPSLAKELESGSAWGETSSKYEDDISLTSNEQPEIGRTRKIIQFFTSLHPYFKLLVLMLLAIADALYLFGFLEKFKAYEGLARQVEDAHSIDPTTNSQANTVLYVMRALIDYKKNLWMTVGAMSVCVATSAYSILLQHNKTTSQLVVFAVAFVDFFSFLCIPVLLLTRLIVASHLHMHIPSALLAAQNLVNPTQFMNELKCSITTREALPLCSSEMIGSILPIKILEFLLVVCVLAAAYLVLVQIIMWCIRHFFPPSTKFAQPPASTNSLIPPTPSQIKAMELYNALPLINAV